MKTILGITLASCLLLFTFGCGEDPYHSISTIQDQGSNTNGEGLQGDSSSGSQDESTPGDNAPVPGDKAPASGDTTPAANEPKPPVYPQLPPPPPPGTGGDAQLPKPPYSSDEGNVWVEGNADGSAPSNSKQRCRELLGTDAEVVVLNGNQSAYSSTTDRAILLSATGNLSRASIVLKGDSDKPLKGACVFLSGNQSRLSLAVETAVEKIVIFAQGNQCGADIDVRSAGKIVRDIQVHMSGNSHRIHVGGAGQYSCPRVTSNGNDNRAECAQ